MFTKILLGALVSMLALSLTGCAQESPADSAPCDSYDGLGLVIGVHANQPAPNVPATLACSIQKTIEAGGSIGVVANDGAPYVLVPAQTFEVEGNNPATTRNNVVSAVNYILGSIQQAEPRTAGSNLYAALTLAADLAHSAAPTISTVQVVDAGLPDTGAVDLTVPGGTLVSSEQLVGHLSTTGALTSDTFAGLQIDFWGLASTSLPQQPLAESQANNIQSLWPSIVVAGGGTSSAVVLPRTGDPVETELTTDVVEVVVPPALEVSGGTTMTFDSTSALGFASGESVLADPGAAAAALAPVAEWLMAADGRSAIVTGRTDSEGPELNGPLSHARAAAVVDVLVSFGVDPAGLTVVGAAYTASPPDRLADGSLDPYAAALNRVTEIELVGR